WSVSATSAEIAASSVTSRWAARTEPPRAGRASLTSFASSSSRTSVATTDAPSAANASHMARPIPLAAPVTRTRFSSKFISILLLVCCGWFISESGAQFRCVFDHCVDHSLSAGGEARRNRRHVQRGDDLAAGVKDRRRNARTTDDRFFIANRVTVFASSIDDPADLHSVD